VLLDSDLAALYQVETPCVAPHTANFHTLITLGVSILRKPFCFKGSERVPRGFDSHRPLHFQPLLANASQLDLQFASGATLLNLG
jgi:hypothetical protein